MATAVSGAKVVLVMVYSKCEAIKEACDDVNTGIVRFVRNGN
jgi:hypothetical protein